MTPTPRFTVGTVSPRTMSQGWLCEILDHGKPVLKFVVDESPNLTTASLAAHDIARFANQITLELEECTQLRLQEAAKTPIPIGRWQLRIGNVQEGDMVLYPNPVEWKPVTPVHIGRPATDFDYIICRSPTP